MGIPAGHVLLTRALNATRPVYFPTYVGLRLIASQLAATGDGFFEQLITRRLNTETQWRFRSFPLYKGSVSIKGEVSHEYRRCTAPSPVTAMVEALVLAVMANDPAFCVPPRAYSYRWPTSSYAGGNYEFYIEGYRARNNEIAASLQSGRVAVVTDIKQFYPSADTGLVLQKLRSRLERKNSAFRQAPSQIVAFFKSVMDAGGNEGIPIGPSVSHILGHLALDEVDEELTSKYGSQYYRYVDDIVVVSDAASAKGVEQYIASSLKRHGFEMNASKTARLKSTDWRDDVIRPDLATEDNFRSLIGDLVIYLAFHPNRASELSDAFRENGLSVPVKRLLALSSYSKFRYFLRRHSAGVGWRRSTSVYFMTNDKLVRRAVKLKHEYEAALNTFTNEDLPHDSAVRRWKVQRIKRIVNVLFYLRAFDEWNTKMGQLQHVPELLEQRCLANALRSGSVLDILPFFPRGPAAFAELWGEYGAATAKFQWPASGLLEAELESATLLQLYGLVQLESEAMPTEPSHRRLLEAAATNNADRRSDPDLSFEDEFESLRLGSTNEEIATLARTRYSLTENAPLDALALLTMQYVS
jgi:Reverse transcriptase (RNA-dependent DNA polymerase)